MIRRQFPTYVIAISTGLAVVLLFWLRSESYNSSTAKRSGDSGETTETAASSSPKTGDVRVDKQIIPRIPLRGIRMVIEQKGENGEGDVELVFQTPEGYTPGLQTKAILFMAHGCSHAATDMFDKSDSCLECIGLPIEKRIVRAALEKGFAVIAVTSSDRCVHAHQI